jgi:hypothetical protein
MIASRRPGAEQSDDDHSPAKTGNGNVSEPEPHTGLMTPVDRPEPTDDSRSALDKFFGQFTGAQPAYGAGGRARSRRRK